MTYRTSRRRPLPRCNHAVIVTPTGDRHEFLSLAELYVRRLIVPPNTRTTWLVVDDGQKASDHVKPDIYVRRQHDRSSHHTLPENMLAALEVLPRTLTHLVIMEDDDWYAPHYLETLMSSPKGAVGLTPTEIVHCQQHIYTQRAQIRYPLSRGSSVCFAVTSLKKELLPQLARACRGKASLPLNHRNRGLVDMRFWKSLDPHYKEFINQNELSRFAHVGFKGYTVGRSGKTWGHNGFPSFTRDPDRSRLRTRLAEDFERYAGLVT